MKYEKDINVTKDKKARKKEIFLAKLEQRRRMTLRKWNLNPSVKLYNAVVAPRTIFIILTACQAQQVMLYCVSSNTWRKTPEVQPCQRSSLLFLLGPRRQNALLQLPALQRHCIGGAAIRTLGQYCEQAPAPLKYIFVFLVISYGFCWKIKCEAKKYVLWKIIPQYFL